ncbi:TniQ family protein [Streptomyces sp. NPDC002057]|uniref:TniQ family protein n=1 Tax=Streptomyces sp. NPDC002057 TaxID=3154664 RepID=UPI00332654AF
MPIRYAPFPGEALDSWLEAIAARLSCPFTDVLGALGLPNRDPTAAAPVLPRWTTWATADELAAITDVTGVAADVLTAMTLQPYDGHAVEIVPGQRRVHRQALWGRAGSRFCPACLEETGGRWQLTWLSRNDASRVWVLVHEQPEGSWDAGCAVVRHADLTVLADAQRAAS